MTAGFPLWLHHVHCVVSPPDDGECEDCHPTCESCSGEEKSQCTKCAKGPSVVIDVYLLSDLQQRFHIFEAYPAILRRSDDVYSSFPPPGRFLTTQQTCVSKCPGGFFASRLSGVCEACPPGCLQCVDAQHCTRCQSTRRAQLFLQDGQCVQQCVRSGVNPINIYMYNCIYMLFTYWDVSVLQLYVGID